MTITGDDLRRICEASIARWEKAERERDEARAESERLRALLEKEKIETSKAWECAESWENAHIQAVAQVEAMTKARALTTPAPADGMRKGGLLPGLRHAREIVKAACAERDGYVHMHVLNRLDAEIASITAAEQHGEISNGTA
jgi:hypothetical protein